MLGRRASFVVVLLAALVAFAPCALAQQNTGAVYGHVVDAQGGNLPGASASLTGPLAPRVTVSDANGNFRFLKVPPGRYKVTITMPGFTTFQREDVVVSLGKDTDVSAELRLSNVQEQVVVTGTTPLIETRKVETGATFSREELQNVPTARDIYALMQQVPGIQIDTVNVGGNASGTAGGPDFSSKGSGGVTYQVDGATITDNSYGAFNSGQARQSGGTNTFFDFDTFQEVEVATGGSLLDLQQPGVTINVVTKRGTNNLSGSARFLYASDSWQSSNQSKEAIDQGLETDRTHFIREYGAEVGGPIIKDRLWLWGSGSRQDIVLRKTGTDPDGNPITSAVKLEPWAFKVNAQITDKNSAAVFYQRSDRLEAGRGNSPERPPDTRTTLSVPTNFFKIEDSHAFGTDLFVTGFISYQDPKYHDVPAGGLNQQSDYVAVDTTDGYSWLHSYYFYEAKNPQYQGNLTVSKFFNTKNVSHELKASFNYRRQVNDSATGWPGDQIFGYTAYAYVVRNVRTIYKTEYFTGTLGDTITAGNFTVNAGLRYDVQRGKNLPSNAAGNPLVDPTTGEVILPPVQYLGDEGYPFEYKDLQPRISAAYSIGKDRKTQVRASYARYADQLGFITYQANGLPITSGLYYGWSDTNGDNRVQPSEIDFASGALGIYNVDPSVAPNPPNRINPNLTTPKTDEITLGFDHQLFQDFAINATYTYRHLKDLQYRRPLGSTPSTWELRRTATGSATADNGFTLDYNVPFYFLTLDDTPSGDEFLNRPGATQNYHGIEFSAVKRFSNKWMMRANFGWNHWTQSIPQEAILDPNNRWNLAGQNEDGGTVVGYSGKDTLWINARWQFNVSGMYQLPWEINASANFFGREGYPQSYYVRSRQADIDGVRTRNLIGKIDQFRLDNVYELDLRLEKTFKVGGVSLTAIAECFNVTNNDTVLQRESRVGDFNTRTGSFAQNGAFNQIIETQSPRIFRFGGRVSF